MVTTIQLTDYKKSDNWMFPVTEGPITECLLYLWFRPPPFFKVPLVNIVHGDNHWYNYDKIAAICPGFK